MKRPSRTARVVLALAALLVPRWRRAEWRREWEAEVDALERRRASGRGGGLPGPTRFALGAVGHAWWLRRRGWTLDNLVLDVRSTLRGFGRSPAFAVTAVVVVALGVGVNGALFSLVDALALRPPAAIEEPDELLLLGRSTTTEARWEAFSWPNAGLVADGVDGVARVAGYSNHRFRVGPEGESRLVAGHFVTGGWFEVLGVQPALGRLLGPGDDVAVGGHPVVVLSHGFWVDEFQAAPDVVGRTLPIEGVPHEVVGVAPGDFTGIERLGEAPRLFVTAVMNPGYGGDLPFDSWKWKWLTLVARPAAGVAPGQVEERLAAVAQGLREAHPDNEGLAIAVTRGVGSERVGVARGARLVRVLGVSLAAVLLLTGIGVTSLFVARGVGRTGETGVRRALGAGRGRIAAHFLVEGGVVAGLAVLLGLPLVARGGGVLARLLGVDLMRPPEVDPRVLLFVVASGLAATLLFGLVPAWVADRGEVRQRLQGGGTAGRGGASPRGPIQELLVVGQLALSLALVTGAGLVGRSVLAVHGADPGFEPRGVQAAFVWRATDGDANAEANLRFVDEVLAALDASPGVADAGVASGLPVTGGQNMGGIALPGETDRALQVETTAAGPGYFETLGIPLVRGRTFRGMDDEPEPVIIVNQALAARLWPGQDPLGRRVEGGYQVVGVVGDVQMRSLREPANPGVYFHLSQWFMPRVAFVVRPEPGVVLAPGLLDEAIRGADSDQEVVPIPDVWANVAATMNEVDAVGILLGAFATLALLLSGVGLYGVAALAVERRTREFGVRMALGARPGSLERLVLARSGAMAGAGVLLGAVLGWGVARSLAGVLFGVAPLDPVAFGGAAVALVATAGVAAWIPARRATRIDPTVAMRG